MRYFLLLFSVFLLLSCQTSSKKELKNFDFYPHVTDTVGVRGDMKMKLVKLNTENRELFFSKRLEKNLEVAYRNIENEMAYCLHGTVNGDTILVREASIPRIMASTDSTATVDSKVCKRRGNYLGLIHNHNDVYLARCAPSETDLRRFSLDKEAVIEVIACPRFDSVTFFVLAKNRKKE